jgi:hypothetical protein
MYAFPARQLTRQLEKVAMADLGILPWSVATIRDLSGDAVADPGSGAIERSLIEDVPEVLFAVAQTATGGRV